MRTPSVDITLMNPGRSFVCAGIERPPLLTTMSDQRKRFLDEMTRFLEHSKQEQQIRLSGRIPNVDEYWHFRMGTSAVGIAVAALE
jgi:hypothetical protein